MKWFLRCSTSVQAVATSFSGRSDAAGRSGEFRLRARWTALAVCLSGPALAGSGGPPVALTPERVLRDLPGVTVTQGPTSGRNHSFAVSRRVGPTPVRVLVTPGAAGNSSTINTVLVYVEAPSATASQRQALVEVARGFFRACAPQMAVQAAPLWTEPTRTGWAAARGWQTRVLGGVRVGWSGPEGLTVAGTEASGLSVEWPGDLGRCVL